ATYGLRISNIGLKTTINFRIQDHLLLLVETEGSYTLQNFYSSLDVHVGQSYSVLLFGIGIIRYPGSEADPFGPLPSGPHPFDYIFSMEQARSISINISRTLFIKKGLMYDLGMKLRYTLNGISFVHPDTPLKLAEYFQLPYDIASVDISPDSDSPFLTFPTLGTSVINVNCHDFIHIVFYNPLSYLQSYHIDGYNFFVVGIDRGPWDESKMAVYNMVDVVSRYTVYPFSWTAILIKFDNQGTWNLRSQDAESWYLGQELYLELKVLGRMIPQQFLKQLQLQFRQQISLNVEGRPANLYHDF
ncbi:hypothetical protein CICLE_v10003561mg, partial [Citrus x clementina]